jgi:hypothetical protein
VLLAREGTRSAELKSVSRTETKDGEHRYRMSQLERRLSHAAHSVTCTIVSEYARPPL